MAEENTDSAVDESNNHQEDTTTNTDKDSGNGGTPSTNDINVDDVLGGWSEDRERNDTLERENFNLKRQLAEKSTDDEEDEELDMDERVSREIKRRDSNQTAEMELDKNIAEKQVSRLKVIDPYFRKNVEKVLQHAIDAKLSLSEANKSMKEREGVNKETINKADDARKKNASQDTKGKGGKGTVDNTKYDPKVDGEKSISELLREGL